MTFSYTDIYPDNTELLLRKWFREEGVFTFTVPNDTAYKWLYATGQGCGGMGDNIGGGGAMAKSRVPVTPGEILSIQVGKVSTASVLGDSFVKRANNSTILYADRGRGNGTAGLAANSTGDIKRDGFSNVATPAINVGAPSTDLADLKSLGFGGFGYQYAQNTLLQGVDPGGGGRIYGIFNSEGAWTGLYTSEGAGAGSICLELFSNDPGALV